MRKPNLHNWFPEGEITITAQKDMVEKIKEFYIRDKIKGHRDGIIVFGVILWKEKRNTR